MNNFVDTGTTGTRGVFSEKRDDGSPKISIEKAVWQGWDTVRLLGSGGYGSVFEIEREIFGEKEKAALKVITIGQDADGQHDRESDSFGGTSETEEFSPYLKNIVDEYSLMRRMNGSANIVNCDDVHYVQHDDGRGWDVFIKMELLTPLLKSLGPDPSVPEEKIVKIGKDICRALILCRKNHIIHRDIKPSNILVSKNGDYKLGDFGIAKHIEKLDSSCVSGSLDYMAPEVYHEEKYDSRVDIYSLGMVLYYLLNNRSTPFLGKPNTKSSKEEKREARDSRFRGEDIPAPARGSRKLKRIIQKACAFDPRERYQTPEEMLQDLEKVGPKKTWIIIVAALVVAAAIIAILILKPEYVESESGVSIANTVLLDEKGIKITALRYDADPDYRGAFRKEYIAFKIENNSDIAVQFPYAFIRINDKILQSDLSTIIYDLEPHTVQTSSLCIDPEFLPLTSSNEIKKLKASCVIRDRSGNEITRSKFINIPVKDGRDRSFNTQVVNAHIVDEDILKIDFLGYRVEYLSGNSKRLYMYFYELFDGEETKDKYLDWYNSTDTTNSVILINDVEHPFVMSHMFYGVLGGTGQKERCFSEDLTINDDETRLSRIVLPFSIYARDWKNNIFDELLSSKGIEFRFDENGTLVSYSGAIYKNDELWNSFFLENKGLTSSPRPSTSLIKESTNPHSVSSWPNQLIINPKSATWIYDGLEHSLQEYTVEGLKDGDVITKVQFKSSSCIRNVGSVQNEIYSVRIVSAKGESISEDKYILKSAPGSLTIKPFPLTLTAVSDEKVFDGQPLINTNVKASKLANSSHTLTADYEVIDSNGRTIVNGPIDKGTYYKRVKNVKITDGEEDITDNYSVTAIDGTLIIK